MKHAVLLAAGTMLMATGALAADPVTLTVHAPHGAAADHVAQIDVNWPELAAAAGWDADTTPQVWITHADGTRTAAATQWIAGEDGQGRLFWLMPGATDARSTRVFTLAPSEGDAGPQGAAPAHGVEVKKDGDRLIVSTGAVEVVHDATRGGTIVSIADPASGMTAPVTMSDAVISDRAWTMAADKAATVRVLESPSRLAAIVEVTGRFTHGEQAGPSVTYRYIYRAGSPLVRVEVAIPRQQVEPLFQEVQLFTLSFGDKSPFDKNVRAIMADGRGRLVPDTFERDPSMARPKAGQLLHSAEHKASLAIITPLVPHYRYDLERGVSVANADLFEAWQGQPLRADATLWLGPDDQAETWVARCVEPTVRATIPAIAQRIANVQEAAQSPQPGARTLLMTLAGAAEQRMATLRDLGSIPQLLEMASAIRRDENLAVLEAPPFVAIANAHTGLLFRIDGQAALVGAFGADGHAFVSVEGEPGSLWQATLQQGERFGPVVMADPAGAVVKHRIDRPDADTATLVLEWDAAPAGTAAVRATATVTLKADDPLSNWRLNIKPTDDTHGLWDVWFPLVRVAPDVRDDQPDFALAPFKAGVAMPSPTRGGTWDHYYPGSAGWAFHAYWQGDRGLYMGAHDPGAASRYVNTFSAGDGALSLTFRTPAPDQGRPGSGLAMDFDIRLGVYRGGWYEAVQLYRQWLVQQEWFPKQKLADRADTPQWLKEVVVAERTGSMDFFGSFEEHWPRNAYLEYHPGVIDNHNLLGKPPTVIWWYHGWHPTDPTGRQRAGDHEHTPFLPIPADFDSKARMLKQYRNIHYVLYTLHSWWDLNHPKYGGPEAEAALAWITSPQPYISNKYGARLGIMCPASPYYLRGISELADHIMSRPDADVSGTYFDLGGTSAVPYCYSPNHGHPIGAGAWRTAATREVIRVMREAGRRHNPQFVVFTEGNADCYLTVADAWTLFQGNIPVRQALYGDYQRSAGAKRTTLTRGSPLEANFPAKHFAWGSPIGRFIGSSIELQNADGPIEEHVRYYRNLVDHKRVASQWLNLGTMLRPLTLRDLAPIDPPGTIEGASVPHAVWQAPDGSVALVFANARFREPVSFSYTFDPASYGLASDGSLALHKLTPEGAPPKPVYEQVAVLNGATERRETLEPGGVLILVVRPAVK